MLNDFIGEMQPAVEAQLHQVVDQFLDGRPDELRLMLTYHLGWDGDGAGPEAAGKRIRSILVLLACAAAGGDWRRALPAAAAVELLHNFSLIHDDIQDNSDLRRGRPTVWKNWGVAQAINAGDLMFTLANLAILGLQETCPSGVGLDAARMLQCTCVDLTEGQYMDMQFEHRRDVTLDEYWRMVRGKTAALLGCCTGLGAMVAGISHQRMGWFIEFGRTVGLAFQAYDDWLGIWGDEEKTGKSTASDLVSGKNTLPVVYSLGRRALFARRWQEGPLTLAEVPVMAGVLREEGAEAYTLAEAGNLTAVSMDLLQKAADDTDATLALRQLVEKLLNRGN